MIEQIYKLNLIPNGVPVIVKASQYDKTARTIKFKLLDGDEPFTVPVGSSVTVQGTKPDKTGYQYACTFDGDTVSFDIETQMTVISGKHMAELRITNNGEILGTANFEFFIEKAGLSDDTAISETELPLLEEAIEAAEVVEQYSDVLQEIDDNIDDIIDLADNIDDIKNAATTATTKAGEAATSATNASNSANAAQTQAGYAKGFAEAAEGYAEQAATVLSSKMNYVSSPTTDDILITNASGQAVDSGLTKNYVENAKRRTRRNITSDLGNLCTAIAEQNLEKYGYSIGDYFVGASGYYYYLADMDTNYGGYSNQAVVSTHHCGIVVDSKSTCQWLSSGSVTNYSSSTLHSFLTDTVLPNVKNDITSLFGSWSSHLIARTELDNAIGGWGTTWTGLASCLICAMSEMNVYGGNVFSADAYQTGTCNKHLELFRKFRFNEIFGNTWIWLKSIYSASYACYAGGSGVAGRSGVSASYRASGLILFY